MNWQTEQNGELSIAEVQAQIGVSARTLRYWEELGLLPGVRRRAAGRRVYGADELQRLAFIQRLKSLGLSLQDIKALNAVYAIGGSTQDMLRSLDARLAEHQRKLAARLAELQSLQDDITRYRERVTHRIATGRPPGQEPT